MLRKISPWKWTNLQKTNVCQILNWNLNRWKIWVNPPHAKLRESALWNANSQIRVVAKQSSKCSVMISTHWRSHISELPGHANPESISSYSLNLLEKQRLISNKLAGFNPSTTTTINSDSSHALREIVLNWSAPPSNPAHTSNRDGSASRSIYLMEGQLAECLLEYLLIILQ